MRYLFVLADNLFSNSFKSVIYTRKKKHSSQKDSNLTGTNNVVWNLADYLAKTNRNRITDNYSTDNFTDNFTSK